MERKRKLKELMGVFKDKVSLIKATLSTKRTTSSIHLAVIRATTHKHTTSPTDRRLSTILSLGDRSYLIQDACVDAIMDRLHKTHNPYVALKCLLIIHNIIFNGFSIFKDQLNDHHSSNGNNLLNLSSFRNDESNEMIELSAWVKWYAGVIECNLITSKVLGTRISYSRAISFDKRSNSLDDSRVSFISSDTIFVKEISCLVRMMEEVCKAPETLHYQKKDVLHDLMLLVAKDIRSIQHHIMCRLSELHDRVWRTSLSDSTELSICLRRLEECRPRLVEIFANRMRNVEFWELVNKRKMELAEMGKRLLGWK